MHCSRGSRYDTALARQIEFPDNVIIFEDALGRRVCIWVLPQKSGPAAGATTIGGWHRGFLSPIRS